MHLKVATIRQAVADGTVHCEVGTPVLCGRDLELTQTGPCPPLVLPGVERCLIKVNNVSVVVEDELPQFLSKLQAVIVKLI